MADQLLSLAGTNQNVLLFDSDPTKWGKSFRGIRCLHDSEFFSLPTSTKLIVTTRDFQSVAERLSSHGFLNIHALKFDRAEWIIKDIFAVEAYQRDVVGAKSFLSDMSTKTCYISGACGGIGYELTNYFAETGASLVLHSRSSSKLESLEKKIRHRASNVIYDSANFNDDAALEHHCSWLEKYARPIDTFFLNAGISLKPAEGGFLEGNIAGWQETLRINLVAPWKLLNVIYSRSKKADTAVKCFVTTSAIQQVPASQAYACSKAALDKMVFDLAELFARKNIQLCLIDPGWVRTTMGGVDAPFSASSIIPGAVFAAHAKGSISVRSICAQDYRGMALEDAVRKAKALGVITDKLH